MLRLLHTADVHLGARHTDLGERAAVLRERQFAAFRTSVELAIVEKVDIFLIAGDLFDSNTQPRRSVERVAAELGRLARAGIRTVIIPGTHDVYDGASIYRSYDLPGMARAASDWVVVLTPYIPEIVFPPLDAIVYGRVFDTKRSPRSPLAGLDAGLDARARWKIGMVHGALSIPGKTDHDSVVITEEEIARTGLDYLALGHWHSAMEGLAGGVSYAYSGAPEPVALDQDGAGQVLLVTLEEQGGHHVVTVEPKRVGQTRSEKLELDVSGVTSQPELIDVLGRHADSNLVFDVRLAGLYPDELDLDLDEIERALSPSFLRFRIRDISIPASPEGTSAPPDTVLGAFAGGIEDQIARLEGSATSSDSDSEELADLREVLRLGRHLLEGRQVTL
ncbi:MAG TPA: DNA repair exonuclease [Candidatus Limnocylindrales bacterium]